MRYVAVVGALAGVLAIAAPAGAKTVHGTVVHQNASAKEFVVAARSGALTVVSARTSPAIARVVDVKVRRAHGAAVARRIRSRGTARDARLRGRISFADAHSFAVSANGASILIHSKGATPPVGSTVTTDVSFGSGDELDADDVQEENHHGEHGVPMGAMKIEGAIQAVDPAARTITLFADDNQEEDDSATAPSAPTVTVHVPDAIDITQFAVGDDVELIVLPQTDGSFVLQSVDENDGDQGEDGNDHGDDGVNSGDGGDSGNGGDGGGSGGGGGHGGD